MSQSQEAAALSRAENSPGMREPADPLRLSPAVAARFERIRARPKILEVESLSKDFGERRALDRIDFEVRRREFLCVLGPSGCGKSTLIRLVAGLEPATEGEVRVDGVPVAGPGPDRGMVFQGYTLFPWLTVKGNVMFGMRMNGQAPSIAEREAGEWIELVGLGSFADAWPHELSGGMKQRVAIARALANRPRLLLMDEPFGALDAQTRAQMQAYLMEIWRSCDATILFITHDLDEAILLADRILVLGANPGRVVEILENPVPRPRTPAQRTSPEFLAAYRRLTELIHPPESRTFEPLRIPRMTEADDDVE